MRIRILTHIFLAVLIISYIGCSTLGDENDYSVTKYNGPAFTGLDIDERWDAEKTAKTITLREIPSRPEASDQGLVMTIENAPVDLPMLIDLWYGPVTGGIGKKIGIGQLEIQKWDLSFEISGAIHTELPSGGEVYQRFWISFEEESGQE